MSGWPAPSSRRTSGVRRATPAIRSRAARTASSVMGRTGSRDVAMSLPPHGSGAEVGCTLPRARLANKGGSRRCGLSPGAVARYPQRMQTSREPLATASALLAVVALAGMSRVFAEPPPAQTEKDEYTRYELLAPGSASFRITYEVTATTPGATVFFNPIRKGSTATDEAVYDRLTGRPLTFEIVPGSAAKAAGVSDADPDTSYIRIRLARPVP